MPLQALSHARPCCAPTGAPPGALCASLRHRTGHAPAATPRPRQGRRGMAEPAGGGQRSECGRGDGLRAEGPAWAQGRVGDVPSPDTGGLVRGVDSRTYSHPDSPPRQSRSAGCPGCLAGGQTGALRPGSCPHHTLWASGSAPAQGRDVSRGLCPRGPRRCPWMRNCDKEQVFGKMHVST